MLRNLHWCVIWGLAATEITKGMLTFATEEMRGLFIGQSFDLYWTFNTTCPSMNEYLEMIDKSKSSFD